MEKEMKKLFGILLVLFSLTAAAWEPTKPINVYIGFAPGSGNEMSFRGVSSIVEKNKNVNFIIYN